MSSTHGTISRLRSAIDDCPNCLFRMSADTFTDRRVRASIPRHSGITVQLCAAHSLTPYEMDWLRETSRRSQNPPTSPTGSDQS